MSDKHIWGYWDCKYCDTKHIRGDKKECPNCGHVMDAGVKFYLDPNYKEEVAETDKNTTKNWTCEFCGAQNDGMVSKCHYCGASRTEHKPQQLYTENQNSEPVIENTVTNQNLILPTPLSKQKSRISVVIQTLIVIGLIIAGVTGISSCINHKETGIVTEIGWSRTIEVEQYTECHESSWSLPDGAKLEDQKREFHHNDKVLDHYETRNREVSYLVEDGYDVSYDNLENGQFREVQTPCYRTEYRTETYQEPVYRNVPVYQTKYYYEIGRWKKVDTLKSSAKDKTPKWTETDIPEKVTNPNYKDKRLGKKLENLWVKYTEKEGSDKIIEKTNMSSDLWNKLDTGYSVTYKGTGEIVAINGDDLSKD